MTKVSFGRPPNLYDARYMADMASKLERAVADLARPATSYYTATSTSVIVVAGTSTSTSTDPVVLQLVTDLKAKGVLR